MNYQDIMNSLHELSNLMTEETSPKKDELNLLIDELSSLSNAGLDELEVEEALQVLAVKVARFADENEKLNLITIQMSKREVREELAAEIVSV